MKLVAFALALVACKGRKDCDEYLDELKAWGGRVDDRLASQHVAVPAGTPSAPGASLEPIAPRTIGLAIDAQRRGGSIDTATTFGGAPLEDPATWERLYEAARLGDPVAIAASGDVPWWRVVTAVALLEDAGFSGVSIAYVAEPIPPPPRANLVKFAMPADDKRVTRYAEWSNRVIDRCPSFGSLMWPQRGHDATPREMAIAAKDCTCEVDPVEISSWFAYDLLPTTMGVARAQVTARTAATRARPGDLARYLAAVRDELTVDAAVPNQLAAKADAPWRDVAGKLAAAKGPLALRIAR